MNANRIFASFLFLIFLAGILSAQKGDVLLHLRFYQGIRGQKTQEAKVITAYGLRPMFVGNLVSRDDLKEEEAELKRVFNLNDLVPMVQTQWGWERQKPDKRFQMVVLNDHEFLLQVTKQAARDAFRVEVISKGKEKDQSLLDTEIILPEKKTSVFGFEDSLGKPYFLALQRPLDASSIREDIGRNISGVLDKIKLVDPQFPKKMLDAGVSSTVIAEVEVNEQGETENIFIVKGELDFSNAVLDAIRKSRFVPKIVDGKPQKTFIQLIFRFNPSGVAMTNSTRESRMDVEEEAMYRNIRSLFEKKLGKDYMAKPFDFDFRDTDLPDVIGFLSTTLGIPMHLDERLKKKVSCVVQQGAWDRVLAKFLVINGLEISDKGQYFRIFSRIPAIWPCHGYVSSAFGMRVNPFTQEREHHDGVDIAISSGTPVVSTADGQVVKSEFDKTKGNYVVIDHGNGYSSLYGKLLSRTVKAGDRVRQGQEIGLVGNTGMSTAPHLHFEIRFKNQPVNPFDVIKDGSSRL